MAAALMTALAAGAGPPANTIPTRRTSAPFRSLAPMGAHYNGQVARVLHAFALVLVLAPFSLFGCNDGGDPPPGDAGGDHGQYQQKGRRRQERSGHHDALEVVFRIVPEGPRPRCPAEPVHSVPATRVTGPTSERPCRR